MTEDDRRRVAAAIAAAQAGTTGRIAVRVIPGKRIDAFERAKREFSRTGLHRHATANAALVLVAPEAHVFAVLGDAALHERVGDRFWTAVVEEMRPHFARGAVSDAIVRGIERLGDVLHEHFPQAEPAP